jgi:hypothetical protein
MLPLSRCLITIFYTFVTIETAVNLLHPGILCCLVCNYNHEAVDISAEAAMTPSSTNDATKWHDVMHIFVSKALTPRKPEVPVDIHAGELWKFSPKFTKEIYNSNWHICRLRYLYLLLTNSWYYLWTMTNAVDMTLQSCKASRND